jgi:hypothetical protein
MCIPWCTLPFSGVHVIMSVYCFVYFRAVGGVTHVQLWWDLIWCLYITMCEAGCHVVGCGFAVYFWVCGAEMGSVRVYGCMGCSFNGGT